MGQLISSLGSRARLAEVTLGSAQKQESMRLCKSVGEEKSSRLNKFIEESI